MYNVYIAISIIDTNTISVEDPVFKCVLGRSIRSTETSTKENKIVVEMHIR